MGCYYCEQPLGKSRKRGFTGHGTIATFHKECYRKFEREEAQTRLSEIRAERLNEQSLYGYELEPDSEELALQASLTQS